MKILIFNWRDIKNPLAGGAEVLTHQVAKRWVCKGHEVVLFSSFFKGAKKQEVIEGVKIIRAGNRISVYWQAYRYYKRFFKGQFDVVIDEINTIPFFTSFYIKEPVICHINQLAKEVWFYESHLPLSLLGYLAEPLILKLYKKNIVITISQSTKEDLLKLGFEEKKIFIIPMGIDFEPFGDVVEKEKEPTLIYVGRLKKSKRVHHIIKAFKIVKEKIPTVKLWIVGDGDFKYKKVLYQMAKGLNNIEFYCALGDGDKLELMRKAHALIVTSIREGWGLVVTEANACGTPAVVYDVPGLRDSTKDKVTGLLCKENNPHALSNVILELLNNKKLREDLARNALKFSSKFGWDRTAEESLKFLEEVLKIRKIEEGSRN
jgi:glycosyltransferase involved in cell wall biosynthesis